MNIVGLGAAGCRIAEAFSQYPQYKIYKIDIDVEGKNCYKMPKCVTAEEYEKASLPKIKNFTKNIKGETLFIIGGSGTISCSSLRILENLKKQPIEILYIKPDIDLLGDMQLLQEKVVFGVMQEYARSGVFEKMYVVSNTKLDEIAGGAPIIGYYDKLNEVLVPAIHMINVFRNTEPVLGKIENPKETHRIITIGLFNPEKDEEKIFFPLDNPRDKCYIYGINEEKLKSDRKLLKKITKQMKSKSSEDLKTGYVVYSTDYDYDIGYIIERTPIIQTQ